LRFIKTAADHHPWNPRSGVRDRLVLADHLETSLRMGKFSHTRSVRETAEAKGIAPQTVATSHRRLKRAGWLTLLRPGRNGEAALWRVRVPDSDLSLLAFSTAGPAAPAFTPSMDIQDRWRGHRPTSAARAAAGRLPHRSGPAPQEGEGQPTMLMPFGKYKGEPSSRSRTLTSAG
jgi:hypothetical protein